jgi:hypothetical protein
MAAKIVHEIKPGETARHSDGNSTVAVGEMLIDLDRNNQQTGIRQNETVLNLLVRSDFKLDPIRDLKEYHPLGSLGARARACSSRTGKDTCFASRRGRVLRTAARRTAHPSLSSACRCNRVVEVAKQSKQNSDQF